MQEIRSIKQLKTRLATERAAGRKLGFVPTMGALHAGHLSLVSRSMDANDLTIASVYVNPTQFNNRNDLKKYPRDPERDCAMLKKAGCDIVFLPTDEEMYPEPDTRTFDFGTMGSVMEGKYRPGHFNGVAQIVSKLFDAVEPDVAYFGQKDFQQLAIIRKLTEDYNYPVKIVSCPIIRETDGLAMSSRNTLLTSGQRKAAPLIYRTLKLVKERSPMLGVAELNELAERSINSDPELRLEYFQIVDSKSLSPITGTMPKTPVTACIAVFAGEVRLIDNVELNS